MIEKVRLMEQRYNELSNKLSEPGIADDQKLFTDLMKEFKNLTPVVEKYREYEKAANSFNEAKELLEAGGMDKDFKEMVQSEFDESKKDMEKFSDELTILLLPKDPNDDKDIVVEIRAGAGGEEAALFAAELFRMYSHYADTKGWKIEVVNADETGIGGMKEGEFIV